MSTWIWSGRTALVWGALVFAAVLTPALAWQYRRWGRWNGPRLLGTAALAFYAVALVTYTWLPLPPRSQAWCDAHHVRWIARPFHFVDDIARALAHGGNPLTSFTVLQVVFNVALFVPLGVLVRRYWHRSVLWAGAAGLAVSLLIEGAQLTGLFWIYPCAFRVADVDDVLLNTTGALVGALVAPLVLWWMPQARLLEAGRLEPRPVTVWRRWTGQLIDGVLVLVLGTAGTVGWRVLQIVLGNDPMTGEVGAAMLGVVVPWLIQFVWPPWRHLAASPGQTAVWLTPVWPDAGGGPTHGSLARRLLRANVVALPWLVASLLVPGLGWRVLNVAWLVLAVASVLLVPFTRGHRSVSCAVTGAELVDIRTLAPAERGCG